MFYGPDELEPVRRVPPRTSSTRSCPHSGFLWLFRAGADRRPRAAPARRLLADGDEPPGPPGQVPEPRDYVAANFASRTMRWTGIIVLLFLAFHLADLTWGCANPDFVCGDVYHNVVASLERVPVAIFYIVANLALGVHLFHGAWSIFQSLGFNNPRFNEWRRWFAVAFAAVIVVGNCSFPIAVHGRGRELRRHEQPCRTCSTPRSPPGPIAGAAGTATRSNAKLVNPNNKRKYEIIVVGTGLAGASAAATLAELGYKVKVFTFHDSPRRAHSIAAQGGINAAKNYRGDGDSIYRLFYDTVKGGDYRSREANVYRLAEVSRRHHRPVRGPGRALRPRVRRPARQPQLRRRPGEPHVLRPGPDRPAAAARRLPGAGPPGRARQRRAVQPHRDARRRRGRRPVRRHRRPRPRHRRDHARTRPTPSCWPPAATRTSSSCRPTPWRATPRPSGGPTAAAPTSPTPASRRSTRRASRRATSSSRSSR